jgi:hypothetical protein
MISPNELQQIQIQVEVVRHDCLSKSAVKEEPSQDIN